MWIGLSKTKIMHMMTLGCIQSCYIPWRGYFDIIRKSDVFVIHDDIQYTKQDWRNRNRIKSSTGVVLLTVPTCKETTKGAIDHVIIDNAQGWGINHWRRIEANYAKAPYFKEFGPIFKEILLMRWENLSALNVHLIHMVCRILGIKTTLMLSSELDLKGKKTDRLVEMCKAVGANYYLSGPSARNYIEPDKFATNCIELVYMNYKYPQYPQLFGDFHGDLSIIDLILNCGSKSITYFDM